MKSCEVKAAKSGSRATVSPVLNHRAPKQTKLRSAADVCHHTDDRNTECNNHRLQDSNPDRQHTRHEQDDRLYSRYVLPHIERLWGHEVALEETAAD